VKVGGGRILKCLADHRAELSPSCVRAGEIMVERLRRFDADCSADVGRLCPGVEPGAAAGGRGLTWMPRGAHRRLKARAGGAPFLRGSRTIE
jgi:hypothetical protein